jgi:hypothetical protein
MAKTIIFTAAIKVIVNQTRFLGIMESGAIVQEPAAAKRLTDGLSEVPHRLARLLVVRSHRHTLTNAF